MRKELIIVVIVLKIKKKLVVNLIRKPLQLLHLVVMRVNQPPDRKE
jgi:hypothetical protein